MTHTTQQGASTARRPGRCIGMLLLLLVLVMLAACSPPKPPLRVGLVAWPPFELAQLAKVKGYFDSKRVELVEFQSPAEAVRAYAVGGLDVVALTLDYVFDLHARSQDHRVFLVIDKSNGGDVAISRTPMASLAELKGRRIGLEAGPLGAHMLTRMLERGGLTPKDVQLAYFDIPDQEAAYKAGKVDVIITYEPIRTRLMQAGGHLIFSSRDMPGEIIDVFVARDSAMRQRADDFRHFSEGWFAALAQFQRQPQASAAIMAPRLDMSTAQFLAAMSDVELPSLAANRAYLSAQDRQFVDGITRFARSVNFANGQAVPQRMESLFSAAALTPAKAAP
jgi:NitT/TauT family transport system substrate-binding protein